MTFLVKSMTGFGSSEVDFVEGDSRVEYRIEIKSVNQRFLDINFKMDDAFLKWESMFKALIQKKVSRGKLDVTIVQLSSNERLMQFNEPFLKALNSVIKTLQTSYDLPMPDALSVLKYPGVLQPKILIDSDKQKNALIEGLEQALDTFYKNRLREGEGLAQQILQRCHEIESLITPLKEEMPEIVAAQMTRLQTRLINLKAEIDEQRLAQEAVLIAQKADVSEEIDRIQLHCEELKHILQQSQPIGRRLDFLMQELNREANTLGAKSVDTRMTRVSIDIKILVEQMREQIQNVE
jgi:uncharacterized protein (TIGR00255 family)